MDELAMGVGYFTLGLVIVGLVVIGAKLWGDYRLSRDRRRAYEKLRRGH